MIPRKLSLIILVIFHKKWKGSSSSGLNFSIPLKKINNVDYLVISELFCRYIRSLEVLSTEDQNFINTKS